MALEKQRVIDLIEVLRDGQLQIREAELFLEDGAEKAKTFHRYVLAPGDDLTGQDPKIVAIAGAVWTPEVIAAYLEWLVNNQPPPENPEDPGEQ